MEPQQPRTVADLHRPRDEDTLLLEIQFSVEELMVWDRFVSLLMDDQAAQSDVLWRVPREGLDPQRRVILAVSHARVVAEHDLGEDFYTLLTMIGNSWMRNGSGVIWARTSTH